MVVGLLIRENNASKNNSIENEWLKNISFLYGFSFYRNLKLKLHKIVKIWVQPLHDMNIKSHSKASLFCYISSINKVLCWGALR